MKKQTLVYIHFYGQPRYVGEGSEHRADSRVRYGNSAYSKFSLKHKEEHCCKVIVASYDNKVSAVLQEQGMISWLGMKIKDEGSLLNLIPYTESNGTCGPLPEDIETERRRKISNFPISKERIKKGIVSRQTNGEPWHSEQTREKISVAQIGRKVSKETRKKISIALRGRTQSEETKKKKSNSLKESYEERKNCNAKRVRAILTDGTEKIFESQGDAGEFFGMTSAGIARVIKTGKTRLKIQSIELI